MTDAETAEIIKTSCLLLLTLAVNHRAGRALHHAKNAERLCTYPTCGHICAPVAITPKGNSPHEKGLPPAKRR